MVRGIPSILVVPANCQLRLTEFVQTPDEDLLVAWILIDLDGLSWRSGSGDSAFSPTNPQTGPRIWSEFGLALCRSLVIPLGGKVAITVDEDPSWREEIPAGRLVIRKTILAKVDSQVWPDQSWFSGAVIALDRDRGQPELEECGKLVYESVARVGSVPDLNGALGRNLRGALVVKSMEADGFIDFCLLLREDLAREWEMETATQAEREGIGFTRIAFADAPNLVRRRLYATDDAPGPDGYTIPSPEFPSK